MWIGTIFVFSRRQFNIHFRCTHVDFHNLRLLPKEMQCMTSMTSLVASLPRMNLLCSVILWGGPEVEPISIATLARRMLSNTIPPMRIYCFCSAIYGGFAMYANPLTMRLFYHGPPKKSTLLLGILLMRPVSYLLCFLRVCVDSVFR